MGAGKIVFTRSNLASVSTYGRQHASPNIFDPEKLRGEILEKLKTENAAVGQTDPSLASTANDGGKK